MCCPGSKNGKTDALSWIFEAKASPTYPFAILNPEQFEGQLFVKDYTKISDRS